MELDYFLYNVTLMLPLLCNKHSDGEPHITAPLIAHEINVLQISSFNQVLVARVIKLQLLLIQCKN